MYANFVTRNNKHLPIEKYSVAGYSDPHWKIRPVMENGNVHKS